MKTVSAISIREGDQFMDAEIGRPVWIAIEDAVERTIDGEDFIAIDVQHIPDGGRETRLFPVELEWPVRFVRRAK
jgi:hypothetical protein